MTKKLLGNILLLILVFACVLAACSNGTTGNTTAKGATATYSIEDYVAPGMTLEIIMVNETNFILAYSNTVIGIGTVSGEGTLTLTLDNGKTLSLNEETGDVTVPSGIDGVPGGSGTAAHDAKSSTSESIVGTWKGAYPLTDPVNLFTKDFFGILYSRKFQRTKIGTFAEILSKIVPVTLYNLLCYNDTKEYQKELLWQPVKRSNFRATLSRRRTNTPRFFHVPFPSRSNTG